MNNRVQKTLGRNIKMKLAKSSRGIIKNFTLLIISLGLIFGSSFLWIPAGSAQDASPDIWQVRAMEADHTGIDEPMGLVFSSRLNAFYALDAKDWRGSSTVTDLIELTPVEDRAGSARLEAAIQDPINMAYDNQANRLLILQARGNQLLAVSANQDGKLDPATLVRQNVVDWGLQNPQGLTVDPVSGDLFILDAAIPRILRVTPNSVGDFGAGNVSIMDLQASGIATPRGIALDPSTGHLQVISWTEKRLYELSQMGEVLAFRDLSQFDMKNPQGMTFAPSGDQTDDPAQMGLYVADSGSANTKTQSTGQIVELSFVAPASLPAGTVKLPATLVRTFATSTWTFPSTDPAGIDYWPLTGKLLISDSEVEEGNPPPYWHGYNVFYSTLLGAAAGNCTTFTKGAPNPSWNNFTGEPTGVAINSANNHIFYSTDAQDSIFEVSPGSDGTYCTSDDLVSRTAVGSLYGATDAEDVGYGNNTVFVSDGANAEVYVIPLGGNQVLGGGDDGPVTHWDTASLGFNDLEGIGYNPDHNTLFIVSTKGTQNYLGETTIGGNLVNVYDLSFMGTQGNIRSDVTWAPSSQNPSVKSIYIASRGIDNDSSRLENDGKVWEISISNSGTPFPTNTPVSTNTPGPSPTPTATIPVSDLIFKDGFESGSLSAWSSQTTDSGDLSVSANAALAGSQGMSAVIDDNNSIYVTDETPNAEPVYRARFYFDPNSISMVSGDTHFILIDYSGTSTAVVRVVFRFSSGAYQIRTNLLNDSGTWILSNWFTISDAPHSIEIYWRAATSAGANNGGLTLWIDGLQKADLTGVDNDTRRVDRARLGAVTGVDSGTRGTYYFDAFESRRQTYIGP
ncbi:MAG TPA: hypothetical protein VK206_04250 [Anaerolineales bacterium]|nr:hypothetical protein [Anaerolineales bacterium]